MKTRQWLMLALLVAVWIGVTRYNNQRMMSGAGLAAPTMRVTSSPSEVATGWTILDPNGKKFDWTEAKGRMILLNVWATWCPPCRAELPSLAALSRDERLKDKLVVLCVSADDRPEQLKAYLKSSGLDFPAYFVPELPSDFVTEGIPATFLISSAGKLLASEIGSARWDSPEFITELMELAESENR